QLGLRQMAHRQAELSSIESLAYRTSAPWHGSCDSVNAGGRGAVAAYFHACVRETTFHAYSTHSRNCDDEPPSLAGGHRRTGARPRGVLTRESGRRHHQGRRPALAL